MAPKGGRVGSGGGDRTRDMPKYYAVQEDDTKKFWDEWKAEVSW